MEYKKLMCAVLCVVLAGCGSSSSNTQAATSPETTLEPTEQVAEATPEPTPTPTPEPKTFLEEQQLTITPQGNFEYTAWAEKGTFPMHASCSIKEEPSETEGYKKVIATITYDVTDTPGGLIYTREFPFDRYTGICFDVTNELSEHLEAGEAQQIESGLDIEYEGMEYTVAYTANRINNWPQLIVELTVLCPQEYDGTVFVVRYADDQSNEQDTALDWEVIRTIDELPYYETEDTFYFTASDQ
ncbi:MAG: hypothetical protein IKE36_00550 [Solobacterium sp.]|nr:hypothetical protein [Solobacterium sp.]